MDSPTIGRWVFFPAAPLHHEQQHPLPVEPIDAIIKGAVALAVERTAEHLTDQIGRLVNAAIMTFAERALVEPVPAPAEDPVAPAVAKPPVDLMCLPDGTLMENIPLSVGCLDRSDYRTVTLSQLCGRNHGRPLTILFVPAGT
jgi:hypothetical protein